MHNLLVYFNHLKRIVQRGESNRTALGFLKSFVAEVEEYPCRFEVSCVGNVR